jgi:hypothetical protein
MAVFWASVIRGISKPLLVDEISNFAEASGEAVPIPVCEKAVRDAQKYRTRIIPRFLTRVFFQN